MMRVGLAGAATLLIGSPAAADVTASGANSFEVRHSVTLVVPPDVAFATFSNPSTWWSDDHTYSGQASNLTLDPRAGGCFCERLDGGGVEHLRVTVAQPGKRLVLSGSLGPLLYEATAGVMDVVFDKVAGGSKVTMTYRAAGFARGGGERMAPLVDQVLGQQMKGFRAAATANAGR